MASDWSNPFQEFAGRHAIVAGVGKGSIGAAIASALHSLGAIVTVLDIQAVTAEDVFESPSSSGAPSLLLQADLTNEDERRRVLDQAMSQSGPPAYFVSTIGLDERIPFAELTQTRMRRLYEVNFPAPFSTAKDLLEPMRRGGGGAMLLFTSHHADQITDPHMVGYGTAKAALNKGIAYLANAAGAGNTSDNIIRVNGLCPGWVWTPNQNRRFKEQAEEATTRQAIPIAMTADGLVGTTLTILSNKISPYITGAISNADGYERPA